MTTADWTKLLLEMLALVGTALGIFFTMRSDIRVLSHDLRSTNKQLDTLNSVVLSPFGAAMTTLAVQESRLERVEQDLSELRHWRGFVSEGGDW